MKRLLTYGLLLLTILASHFVVSACQEDVPETTEVIMTFTTRALLTQNDANAEINAEQLRTLHVIMRKSDGTIYHASRQDIQENQVTVTFEDVPVSTGEEFEFFAIANQEGIMWNGTAYDVSNPTAEMLSNFPDLTIGNGSVYALTNYLIPQTKYWKEKIYPLETIKIGKQLDFAVGKISVQFVNETNNYQSLNTVKITGVKPNGYGYLFAPIEGGNRVDDYYPQDVNTEIEFENVNIQAGASSSIQHYYTYPIDAANITNPQFTAQWNGTHTLNLSELKELKRGQHLKIVVTLSGVGIQVAYNIVDWVENTTTIGGLNSTLGDDYFIADWEDDDVVIGGPVTVEDLAISANPATIDLASATTTTLTINKPAYITEITITPSGNSAFTRLSNPSSGSITNNFKITGLSDAEGTVNVTLTADPNAVTDSYTLTASGTGGDDYISNEATTIIILSKTQSGGGEISITYEYVEIEGWLTGVKISSQGANIAYPTMYTDEDGEKYAEETEANNNLLSPYFVPGWYNIDGPGHRSWNEAKKECSTLKSNTLSDWRLPTLGELQFLYDTKTDGIFNDYYTGKYWTIVPNVYFDMDTGTVGTYSDSTTNISITNRCITNYEE